MSEFPSFLRVNDTPLYVYTTLCLFLQEIILLNTVIFFIYIYMGFIYGKKVWSSLFLSCTDICLLADSNLFIWGINKVNLDFLLMYFSLCSVHYWVCFMPREACAVVFPFPSSYQNRIPQGQPSSRTDTGEPGTVISVAWQLCACHLCSPPPTSTGH